MKKSSLIISCIFSLLLSFSVGAEDETGFSQIAKDLYTGGIDLHIRLGGGMVSPLFGGYVEAEVRRLGGRIDVFGGAGYGTVSMMEMDAIPLFGATGYQWRVGAAYRFARKDYEKTGFYAVTEVARTNSTITYAGFNFMQPIHEEHLVNLEVRAEPTGNMVKAGVDEMTLETQYTLGPGYSILVFPGYRFVTEVNYILDDFMKNPRSTYISFVVGPIFSPDFSKVGGLIDSNLCLGIAKGVNIYTAVSLGYIGRTNIPKGTVLVNSDGTGDPVTVTGFGSTAFYGYMPMRVAIGFSYMIPLTDGSDNGGEK